MVPNALTQPGKIRRSVGTFHAGSEPRAPEFCFLSGSHLSSLRGDVAVDDLSVGDVLRMKSGAYSPIVELMRFKVPAEKIASTPALRPVLLRRNAVAPGIPKRDVHVTEGQVFEGTLRLKIEHLLRSAAIFTGREAAEELCFTVLRLRDRGAVRVEHVWVEATPAAACLAPRRARPLLAG